MQSRGIGQRVRAARKEKKLTQQQLGDAAGLTQTAVAEIESGRTLDTPKIVELAAALGKSPQFLRTGQELPARRDSIMEFGGAEFAVLPVHKNILFAAGAGSKNWEEGEDEPIDSHLISMSLLRSLTRAPLSQVRGFQADGDSMENTIYNRDWVFVDMTRKSLVNPGIYALVFEEDALLKRAAQHLETKEVTLISDNPKYPVQRIKKPERLTVVGRVILSIRRH